MKSLIIKINGLAQRLTFLPQILSRIIIGFIFIRSGWGKLTHLDKVIGFFQKLGIPAPQIQAPFVASVEFGCGLLVLLGLLTRPAAFMLIPVMAVAILTAKLPDIKDLGDLFTTSEFLFLTILLWLMMTGPGPISLDRKLFPENHKNKN